MKSSKVINKRVIMAKPPAAVTPKTGRPYLGSRSTSQKKFSMIVSTTKMGKCAKFEQKRPTPFRTHFCDFSDSYMHFLLKDSKVEVRGQNPQKFHPKKAYKIQKSASNITIFGQKLVFGTILLKLYFKISCTLLSQGHNINQRQ